MPLEVSPGREATCRAVFGTWGCFPDDARSSHCPIGHIRIFYKIGQGPSQLCKVFKKKKKKKPLCSSNNSSKRALMRGTPVYLYKGHYSCLPLSDQWHPLSSSQRKSHSEEQGGDWVTCANTHRGPVSLSQSVCLTLGLP